MRTARHRLVTLTLLGLAAAPAVHAQTDVERRLDARGDGTVEISNLAGSVTVTGWDKNEVEVTGTLGRGVEDLDVSGSGGRIGIEVEPSRHAQSAESHLEIRLPRGSRVIVGTVSAEVVAAGLEGELDVETVSGTVEAEGEFETLDVTTVSGDVEVRGSARRFVADTVTGTVRLAGTVHDIEADTVSGRLELRVTGAVRRVDLEAVTGSIEFAGGLERGAELDASSHSGSIEILLPPAVSARFEVTTFSGRIRNELGPPPRRAGRFTREQELTFTVGAGDARVRLESFSGSIEILER